MFQTWENHGCIPYLPANRFIPHNSILEILEKSQCEETYLIPINSKFSKLIWFFWITFWKGEERALHPSSVRSSTTKVDKLKLEARNPIWVSQLAGSYTHEPSSANFPGIAVESWMRSGVSKFSLKTGLSHVMLVSQAGVPLDVPHLLCQQMCYTHVLNITGRQKRAAIKCCYFTYTAS